jgi:hypothetical protein
MFTGFIRTQKGEKRRLSEKILNGKYCEGSLRIENDVLNENF